MNLCCSYFFALLCATSIGLSRTAFVINFKNNPYGATKWPSSNIRYRLSYSFYAVARLASNQGTLYMDTKGVGRHEHQRPDRDSHIRLLKDNIDPKTINFFERIDDSVHFDTLNSPYDAYSVMHYEPTLFSVSDDKKTMALVNNKWKFHVIGQKQHLSGGDIDAINALYCNHEHPKNFPR